MALPPAPLIELQDASYRVDGRDLLSGISFRADERRIGIVGRNGSGKTTLARLMAGLVAPISGQVRVGGIDVAQDRKRALRTVGILFQNPDHQIIFPTVEEELGFGLKQMGLGKREVRAQVEATLSTFDRSHWLNAAVHQMSQGQRQLVCLMAIIAMAPRVILLDEPLSGLDMPTAMRLTRVLEGLEATLVHITHDPAVVRDYARVLWIDEGHLRLDGAPGTVLSAFERQMRAMGAKDDLADLAC